MRRNPDPNRPVVILNSTITPYYPLSMSYGGPLRLKNKEGKTFLFPTIDHWMHYNQLVDPELKEVILACPNSYTANLTFRTLVSGKVESLPKFLNVPKTFSGNAKTDPDWIDNRDKLLRVAIEAKFRHHRLLQFLLMDTESAPLIDSSRNDPYWCRPDKNDPLSGENKHGLLLEEYRNALIVHKQEGYRK